MKIRFTLNGGECSCETEPSAALADVLRDTLGLTGTKIGCREGECGACTVLLDGKNVNSCLIPAAAVCGHEVVTIEGLRDDPLAHRLMELFAEGGASQCGFCTPGMVISAYALLAAGKQLSIGDVQEGMSGNLCRCTGYDKIIRTVLRVQEERRQNS